MKKVIVIFCSILIVINAQSQVTLRCDFTNIDNQRDQLYNFWSVRNRPMNGTKIPVSISNFNEGNNLNCIRMLGGWATNKWMSREYVESQDPCKWDGTKYVYDWVPLKERIDKVLAGNMNLYQFVIDNVPWAFTREYTFVEKQDNVHHTKRDSVVTYGNGLPPYNLEDWEKFIVAMMKELVRTYGDSVVEKWQFRITTEADFNPGHWAGTKQEFFDYYKLTYDAIHSVLPDAKVGTQFLAQSHEYPSGKVDYKGNPVKVFGSEFITWCKQNNVKYEFIGTSFYPKYMTADQIDSDTVYHQLIAPFKENPDWDPNAEFHIQEFSLWTPGNIHNNYSHAASHFAMMAQFVYERDIQQIYIWEKISLSLFAPELITMKALKTMVGKSRFTYTKSGNPLNNGNIIDGVFAKNAKNDQFDVLLYNYNVSPEYLEDEDVNLSLLMPFPAGTKYRYRATYYGREQCAFNRFAMDFPLAAIKESEGGWVLNDKDIAGNPLDILNDKGLAVFKERASDYEAYNSLPWTEWKEGITTQAEKEHSSVVNLQVSLPSFAFKKYEVEVISR